MRRKEKLRTDQEFFNHVFDTAEEIFIAFHDGDFPYCLPFNFVCHEKSIYLHSALEGHKTECIKNNPHVGFSLACDIRIDRKKSSTWFKSLCGKGLAAIVNDQKEKQKALDLLAIRYNALCQRPATQAMIDRVAIIRIDIKSITGKNSEPRA